MDRAVARALAARFVNEGPEKIGRALAGELKADETEKIMARLKRPLSEREKLKWAAKDLSNYEWSILCSDRRASDYYEQVLGTM